jgi:hypothetical protein
MTFKFKLFRGLTAFNIMFSTFILLGGAISLFTTGNPQLLLALLLLGAILIHAVLSLHLQKALLDSNMILKESTPGGIRIIGGICILFAGLLMLNGLTLLMAIARNQLEPLEEAMKTMPPEQATIMMTNLKPIAIALVVISGVILGNVFLSFSFLREWKQRQDEPFI